MRIGLQHAAGMALLLLSAASVVLGQEPVKQTQRTDLPADRQAGAAAAEAPAQIRLPSDLLVKLPVNLSDKLSAKLSVGGAEDASAATPQAVQPTHRFWDRENDWLFAGVGAARFFDYASTLNLRRRGLNEVFLTNSIVDDHPLFAAIEAAGTAASIGASYLFHRTGHHRLERWTSIVHFGLTVGGAVRNYSLKTQH